MTYYPIISQSADIAAGVIASSNIASLDAASLTGTISLARLAGITTSQLATTAGIVSGQINDLASSKLTGNIPSAWLGRTSSTASAGDVTAYTDAQNTFSPSLTGGGAYTSNVGLSVSPTVNQSSTAGYTGLQVKVTETAVGSGSKYPFDIRVGSSSLFTVDDTGKIANGSADAGLLTTGTVGLGRLSGITTSQLSASAGITSGQIASVASSTLTGTIPAAWLGSTSTTAMAGNATPTPAAHASTHAPYQSDPTYLDGGDSFQYALDVIPLGRIWGMHDSLTIIGGTLYVTYFTPSRAMSITQLFAACSAVFSGQNYLECALYTAASDSALTMVRRSGNLSGTALQLQAGGGSTVTTNTGMTATGLYALPLALDSASASAGAYSLVVGTRYAAAIVAGASTTVGKLAGYLVTIGGGNVGFSTSTLGGVANVLGPVLNKMFANAYTAGSPIPTSHTGSAGSGNSLIPWLALG